MIRFTHLIPVSVIFLLLAFTGCPFDSGTQDQTPSPVPTDTPAPTATPLPDLALADVTVQTAPAGLGTGVAFVQNLVLGWNLGNTLDSGGYTGFSPSNLADYETSWGVPKTTQAMIDAVKAAGFRTIRIPTTWGQKIGTSSPYTVDTQWMNRVQEVVDYAINDGLYVILNVHHDSEWTIRAATADQAVSQARFSALWTQIATRFASYDDHLVFEGQNEPRGVTNEWSGGTPESRTLVNTYNQLFVDAVRAGTGNNPTRWIMVPPHAASGSTAALNGFVIPTDSHIIVSLHSYSPYNFALNTGTGATATWGSDADKTSLSNELQGYYNTFVSQGIPVILGEIGAMNRNNDDARKSWATWFISEARARYITCVVWDNNSFTGTGETFGLFRRSDLTWPFPKVLQGLINGLR